MDTYTKVEALKTEHLNRPIMDNEIDHLRPNRMAVLKMFIKVQKKKASCTLLVCISTAILENSMKMVPGVELIGNLSGNACISHAHDYSTVHSRQDVASACVHPE